MEPEKTTPRLTAEEARELTQTPERILETIYRRIREKAQEGGRKILVQDFGFNKVRHELPMPFTKNQQLVIEALESGGFLVGITRREPARISSGLLIRW